MTAGIIVFDSVISESGRIVRSFLCDLYIVRVGLSETCAGDAYELCTLLEVGDSRAAAVAHTGAIRLSNGLSITDTDVEKKYADYVDDLTAKAEKDGKSRLEKDTGKTVGKQDQNANNNNAADDGDGETANTNNKNEDKTTTFEENVCQVDVTLTMYSIERMQDPTEQLSSQNNQ